MFFVVYNFAEHFNPLLEQISKLEAALYNIQFEQHWLEAQTDRQSLGKTLKLEQKNDLFFQYLFSKENETERKLFIIFWLMEDDCFKNVCYVCQFCSTSITAATTFPENVYLVLSILLVLFS